ncbi:haloacetate dehalogenase [Atractiella rhizophila]|nr:haloacetate dehalogenase [Atractiella rhizophila]
MSLTTSELAKSLYPTYTFSQIQTSTSPPIHIHTAISPSRTGPPVLLIHGNPQTLSTWHAIAPVLEKAGYTVVLHDLRGYGDSSKPFDEGDTEHRLYTKREMANDSVKVMANFGFKRFTIVSHDRGSRVAHRLAVDFPDRVEKVVLLDIAPTLTMYRSPKDYKEFATKYIWWFFLIQPYPWPERMIEANQREYLQSQLEKQAALRPPTPIRSQLEQEYHRTNSLPGAVHAICEDYRASASIDLELDEADEREGKKMKTDVLVLWGEEGIIGKLWDPVQVWREKTSEGFKVEGKGLPCGHSIQELEPERLIDELKRFLGF